MKMHYFVIEAIHEIGLTDWCLKKTRKYENTWNPVSIFLQGFKSYVKLCKITVVM